MALTVKKGTIAIPAATGNITISSLSDPKAIIVWATYQTAAGVLLGNARWGYGFGTYRGSVVQQGYVAQWRTDGATTSAYAESTNTDALLRILSAAATVDCEIDLVSMSATQVVLNVTDAPATANILLHYLILGGSDILDAEAHGFAMATAVATQDVALGSGMGNPDTSSTWLLFLACCARTAVGQAAGHIRMCLGVSSKTQKMASAWSGQNGVGNMQLTHWQKARALLGLAGAAADSELDLDTTGHPTDGYQLAYPDQAAQGVRCVGLAIRGTFQTSIQEVVAPTALGTPQDVAVGFTPVGALCWGGSLPQGTVIDAAHASLGGQWIGGTDFTTEGAAGELDDDGLGFDNGVMWHNITQTIEMRGATGVENGNELLEAADASVSGSNVRFTYTTINAAARAFCLLALGDAPAAGATSLPAQRQPAHDLVGVDYAE